MNSRSGFSIVELAVIIAVMTILLAIGTLSLRELQGDSRDREREADIYSISMKLESLYSQAVVSTSPSFTKSAGSYPPVNGTVAGGFTALGMMSDGVNVDALMAPGQVTSSLMTFSGAVCASGSGSTCNTNSTTISNRTSASAITKDKYLYYPIIASDDSRLCTVGLNIPCRSFKLYYVLEQGGGTVKVIESRRK